MPKLSKIVETLKSSPIPLMEADDGWETIEEIVLTPHTGIELKKISIQGAPGSLVRIRSDAIKGKSYDATLWKYKSRGIPKSFDLEGLDCGGHEVRKLKVQKLIGDECEANLEYKRHGD
jgi:hypothetical protein